LWFALVCFSILKKEIIWYIMDNETANSFSGNSPYTGVVLRLSAGKGRR
jgi:hypothetical protein